MLTTFLLISGIGVAGEGHPALEWVFGGHVLTAHEHRWVGYLLIAVAGSVLVFRTRAALRFLVDSARFHRSDLRWFSSFPRFLLSGRPPARHAGHFDPGQRVLNLVVLLSFVGLAVTGIVMSFPQAVTPSAFAVSIRLHRAATWVLVGAIAGHVLVASGALPSYRGVWRGMHRGGRIRVDLAAILWPTWTEEQPPA